MVKKSVAKKPAASKKKSPAKKKPAASKKKRAASCLHQNYSRQHAIRGFATAGSIGWTALDLVHAYIE